MKNCNVNTSRIHIITFSIAVLLVCGNPGLTYGDIEFSGGVSAEIDYTVDGSVWIYDANVTIYEPAYILGSVLTASGAVLDVYGGQIDYMLLISTSDETLPEGQVTVYGTDFAVDGIPVEPGTSELFLQNQTLSGVYENGTPFSYIVDCAISGNADYTYYQTVKLGWVVSEPDIEVSQYDYDFGQTDIGTAQYGVLTVYNLGSEALIIQSLALEQDQDSQFGFTPLQVMPLTLAPNTALDIEIFYTPVVEGLAQAAFRLACNDPNDPVVEVALSGEGISVALSPAEQMAIILDTYDRAVEEGSIQGVGNQRWAENKHRVFQQMLTIADKLIAGGYNNYALRVLMVVEKKCDGHRWPMDFIEGAATADLNTLINDLIDTLHEEI